MNIPPKDLPADGSLTPLGFGLWVDRFTGLVCLCGENEMLRFYTFFEKEYRIGRKQGQGVKKIPLDENKK
jgi:hypothetical protein